MSKRTLILTLTLILLCSVHVFGYQLFSWPQVYSGADAMSDIISADIDGDGYNDIISVPFGSDYIIVQYNDGNGFFYTTEQMTVGSQPISVIAKDFDNDGDLDIAVSRNTASDNVKIFSNLGNRNFATPLIFTADQSPVTIRSADMNGDGYLDLVTTNMTNNTISFFSNDQYGSFYLPVTTPIGPTTSNTTRGLTVGDWDSDGDIDLAISTKSSVDNDVYIMLNEGDGSFVAGTNINVNYTHGLNIVADDFDNNGALDLFLPINDATLSGVFVYLNFNGQFVGPFYGQAGTDPVWVSTADFDCDGLVDVAVANRGDENISVLYNVSACALDQPDNYSPGFSWVSSVVASDLDGNGTIDLAGTRWSTLAGGNVGIVKNNFPPTVANEPTCNNLPGDVNQDESMNIIDLNLMVNYIFRDGVINSCSF